MKREGVDVVTAIKANAVPEYIGNALIDVEVTCKCGSFLEFDPTLRRIRCSSELCRCKVEAEADRALSALGISDEEIDNVSDIIKGELAERQAGCWILSSDSEEIVQLVNKGKEIEFNKILKLSGVTILGDSSESLIEGYRSLKDFEENLKKYGAVEVARRLRLDKEISVAATIYDELMRVLPALISAEKNLTVIVKRSEKSRQAGGGSSEADKIYTALQAEADSLSGNFMANNSAAGELVEKINDDRRLKGKDILKIV